MIRWIAGGLALATVAVLTLVMVVQILASDRTDVTDLEVGECFDFPLEGADGDDLEEIGTVETRPCDEPHTAQVVAVGDLNPDRDREFPGDDELVIEVDGRCAVVESDPRFGVLPIVPTRSTWDGRGGRYVCVALAYGIVPVTGDHVGIER